MSEKIINDLLAASPNRRRFLQKLGAASAIAGAVAATTGGAAYAQSAPSDADIVNFALNLEYLEAEFYTVATTGLTVSQAGIDVTGSGSSGPTTGAPRSTSPTPWSRPWRRNWQETSKLT